MKIAFLTAECEPYAKTGGLGDVSSALPVALTNLGCNIRVFLPLYKQIDTRKFKLKKAGSDNGYDIRINKLSHHFNLFSATKENVDIYFIDCPEYYHRDSIYTNDADEDERFIFFQYAALTSLEITGFQPDIIHCNDWQSALVPEILNINFRQNKFYENIKTLLTIHNLAYQGTFKKDTSLKSGLPIGKFFPGGPYELYGNFNFLKIGIEYADSINTVSHRYSEEILTKEYGAGLEDVLETRKGDLSGILNGIDTKEWNPESDNYLPVNYNYDTLNLKSEVKKELLRRSHLNHNSENLLIGMVSRFVWQKGYDILNDIMDEILSENIEMIILGDGDKKYLDFFQKYIDKYPGKICLHYGYNNELAHLITAGSDAFLMPSRYEPCGLNQMYSLRYGTLPIVRKTGGLADTVTDISENEKNGNGFVFENFVPFELMNKINTALDIFMNDKEKWKIMQKRGMEMNFTWNNSAGKYLRLYNSIIK